MKKSIFLGIAVCLAIFVYAASVVEAKSGSGNCSISINDGVASVSYNRSYHYNRAYANQASCSVHIDLN